MKGPAPTEMMTSNRSTLGQISSTTLGQISSTTLVKDLSSGQNKGPSLHHCRAPNQTTLCVPQQVVQAACARYEHQHGRSVRTTCCRPEEMRMMPQGKVAMRNTNHRGATPLTLLACRRIADVRFLYRPIALPNQQGKASVAQR
jgi:hypothetical protein